MKAEIRNQVLALANEASVCFETSKKSADTKPGAAALKQLLALASGATPPWVKLAEGSTHKKPRYDFSTEGRECLKPLWVKYELTPEEAPQALVKDTPEWKKNKTYQNRVGEVGRIFTAPERESIGKLLDAGEVSRSVISFLQFRSKYPQAPVEAWLADDLKDASMFAAATKEAADRLEKEVKAVCAAIYAAQTPERTVDEDGKPIAFISDKALQELDTAMTQFRQLRNQREETILREAAQKAEDERLAKLIAAVRR